MTPDSAAFDPASYVFSQPSAPTVIRASTVLPAHRENVELRTADGHRLVGELALPESGVIRATLITLHPLPTHGGFMDSHVYRKASYRLPALAGIAVLRFNTRGTSSPRGASTGEFEEGIGERLDVEAAVRFAVDRGLPNRWLVGWSFGTELALMYGATEPVASEVEGAILLSPPLHRATDVHLKQWADSGKPLKVLVPEHDDYLQPAAATQRFGVVPQARVVGVEGAKHLWVGEKHAGRVLNEIVAEVLSGAAGGNAGTRGTGGTGANAVTASGTAAALPHEWNGPVATAHA